MIITAFISMIIVSSTTGAIAYLVEPIMNHIFVNKDKTIYIFSFLNNYYISHKGHLQNIPRLSDEILFIKNLRKNQE